MRKIISVLLALAMLCSFAVAESLQFATEDMEGNVVTHEIFADYDLTMVNVWASWCGFCMKEMPTFPDLKDSLPEGCNLITICTDANNDPELISMILEAFKANYLTLVPSQSLHDALLKDVFSLPTTLFVDSEGKLVGDAFVGVPSLEDPAGAYLEIIDERLAMLAE